MPALNFMKRFVPMVAAGEKTHSIRATRRRSWSVGDNLALYTGMRQKGCTLIGRTSVIKAERITIRNVEGSGLRIAIDGENLSPDERRNFARRDGFQDISDMADFWIDTHGLPFEGDVIHWKYPFELERKDATV